MIAELANFFRRGTRPLGRAYWWPGRSKERNDAAGVLLVSLANVDDKNRRQLLKQYRYYYRQPLVDDARPGDGGLNKRDSGLAVLYRLLVFAFRTLYFCKDLACGKLSWSAHLCECDGLARAHQAVMLGLPYHHLGDLRGRPWRDLRHLERLVRTLDHRRYEVWLVFRERREAYVPASLALPDVPLTVAELEEQARHRSDPLPTVSGLRQLLSCEGTIRIMTYNVHSCVGLDGRLSVRRVAEVLARYNPHFVALQELDCGCRRSGSRDQLAELSVLWPSEAFFFPAIAKTGGQYGIGCLSRLPVRRWQGQVLPRPRGVTGEPRVAIEAEIELPGGGTVTVVNTHLGLSRADRMAQIKGLESILDCVKGPAVLMGDLNCPPRSRELKRLMERLQAPSPIAPKTWFGSYPVRVLDYILLRQAGRVRKFFVPIDALTRVASDHLPLVADLKMDAQLSDAGASPDG